MHPSKALIEQIQQSREQEKNHRNLNRTFGEGVDNYGFWHSIKNIEF
jgi:hypothetical protein